MQFLHNTQAQTLLLDSKPLSPNTSKPNPNRNCNSANLKPEFSTTSFYTPPPHIQILDTKLRYLLETKSHTLVLSN